MTRPAGSDGHGPFVWEIGGSTFGGIHDPTSYFGYNVSDGGTPLVAGEPYAASVIEADYFDGTNRTMELYWEARSTRGVNLRPSAWQVKRDADTIETFLLSSFHYGNPFRILTPRPFNGTEDPNALVPGTMADFRPNRLDLYATDPHDTFVTLHAAPNFNSGLIMECNGSEVVRMVTASSNQLHLNVNNKPFRFYAVNGGQANALAVNVDDDGAIGTFAVGAAAPASRGIVARGRSGGTGSLLEVQNSASAVLSRFDKSGYFMTRKTTQPANTDLASSEMALWLDASTGSGTKLMIKAKDSAGVVKTGSVRLS